MGLRVWGLPLVPVGDLVGLSQMSSWTFFPPLLILFLKKKTKTKQQC